MNHSNIILTGGPAHIPAVRSRGLALGRRTMALLISLWEGGIIGRDCNYFFKLHFPRSGLHLSFLP